MLPCVGIRPHHPRGFASKGKGETRMNVTSQKKKVDVMNSIRLKISLRVLLSVTGESGTCTAWLFFSI